VDSNAIHRGPASPVYPYGPGGPCSPCDLGGLGGPISPLENCIAKIAETIPEMPIIITNKKINIAFDIAPFSTQTPQLT